MINQNLPSITQETNMIIEILYTEGITYGEVNLIPTTGETINRSSSAVSDTAEGVQGLLVPLQAGAGYEFFTSPEVEDSSVEFYDGESKQYFAANKVKSTE